MALRFIAVATAGTVVGAQIDEIVEGDPVIIGRDGEADLVLLEPTVSRRHVEVRSGDEGWEIVDLGSRLGTWLNGKKLRAGEGAPLREGDEVEMGLFRVKFLGEQEDKPVQDTREIAMELAMELEMVEIETALKRPGAGMFAPVIGLAVGFLSLLAAALL